MIAVRFATITELDKQATVLVAEAEKAKCQIAITKRGKPVGLLRNFKKRDKGRTETVSNIKNRANALLAEIEKSGGGIVITRNGKPVALLVRINYKAFRLVK